MFRATDSKGGFALGALIVDVRPVDDAPVLLPLPEQARGGGAWVLDLRPYVSDVDTAIQDLTFTTDRSRVEAVGFLLVFDYPNADASESVLVTVRDPAGLTASRSLSVRVTGPPPIGIDLLWPWSGFGAFALAALAFLVWTRVVARRFSIEDLFLIGREGRLIMHTTRRLRADRDSDILAGMLTAIMLFVRDSFKEENEDLKRFEFGDRKVSVERGEHVIGAAIFAGEVPEEMSVQLNHFLTDVEDRYADTLAAWSGDVTDMPGLKAMMEDFGRRGKWRVGDWRKLAAPEETEAPPAESEAPEEESPAEDEL